CLIAMWLINGKVPPENVAFLTFFNLYDICFVFVIHFLLAFYSKQIHKPAKPLIDLSVANQHRIGHFRTRLRLTLDIEQLHTQNQYGFTYGKYGLISLNAFSKVLPVIFSMFELIFYIFFAQYLMLYGKIMMISYKLVQENF